MDQFQLILVNITGNLKLVKNLKAWIILLLIHCIPKNKLKNTLLLSFASLGSIYGDISTSPLYTLNSLFNSDVAKDDVFGAACIIFYLFTFIVIIKYSLIVIKFGSFKREGGQIALYSKISLVKRSAFVKILCFMGCSLVIADGLLTPSVSVLNAISGLSLPFPEFNQIVPLSIIILIAIFSLQYLGANRISFIFAPIIFIWLICLGGIGAYNIYYYPQIILALHPIYGIRFLLKHGVDCITSLVLAITGAEVLFLDLGYIGKLPIQIALGGLVYPCLMMNYFGQCAYLVKNPLISSSTNVFYNSIPGGSSSQFYWIVFVLATLATIIATQALILGVFTIIYQLSDLGLFPKVKGVHFSKSHKHKVYLPEVNFTLLLGLIATVLIFRNPNKISMAYGLGISIDFLITSLMTIIALVVVNNHKCGAILFSIFVPIEIFIIYANMGKFREGGWLTMGISFAFFIFLMVYNRGNLLI